jgi:hypothetical protein
MVGFRTELFLTHAKVAIGRTVPDMDRACTALNVTWDELDGILRFQRPLSLQLAARIAVVYGLSLDQYLRTYGPREQVSA